MLFVRRATYCPWSSTNTQTEARDSNMGCLEELSAPPFEPIEPELTETQEEGDVHVARTSSGSPVFVILCACLISFMLPTMCHIPAAAKLDYQVRKDMADSIRQIWNTVKDLENGQQKMEVKMEKITSGLSKLTDVDNPADKTDDSGDALTKKPDDYNVDKEENKKDGDNADVERLRGGHDDTIKFGKVHKHKPRVSQSHAYQQTDKIKNYHQPSSLEGSRKSIESNHKPSRTSHSKGKRGDYGYDWHLEGDENSEWATFHRETYGDEI